MCKNKQTKKQTDVYFSTVRGIKILLERLLLSVNPVKSCERTALTQLSSFCSHAAKDSSDLPIKMNLTSEMRISMTQCFQRSHRSCTVQPGCHVRKREREKKNRGHGLLKSLCVYKKTDSKDKNLHYKYDLLILILLIR